MAGAKGKRNCESRDARVHRAVQGRGRSEAVQGAGKSFYRFGEDHPREVKQGGRGAAATAARAGGPESYVMSSAVPGADLSAHHAEED